MNKEMLNPEMLEKVNGGLIVQGESYEGFFIVYDKTGEVLDQKYFFQDAEKSAKRHNVGVAVVNKATYKKYYGHDIN